MVVQGSTVSANSFQLSSIMRAHSASGKITLPFNGGLYLSLKHVKGIPSGDAQGLSLTKLQMMDLMVERLVKIRGDSGEALRSADGDPDARLANLAEQLHAALKSVSTPGGSYSAGLFESGLLFDLVA